MPKRTPLQSVVVIRDGARFTPEIGRPFEFTKDEIEQVERANPAALSKKAVVDLTEDGKPLGDTNQDGDTNPDGGDTKEAKTSKASKTSKKDEQL